MKKTRQNSKNFNNLSQFQPLELEELQPLELEELDMIRGGRIKGPRGVILIPHTSV